MCVLAGGTKVCYADNLTSDENQLLFGTQVQGAGIPHIYSTAQALHFAKSLGLVRSLFKPVTLC